jgi:hypothetical protein
MFAKDGVPFMNFAQFNNLVQLYRDEYWASQYVEDFINDIGVRYNVWTRSTVNTYYRHIFFDEIKKPISISFRIPHLSRNATIPLHVSLFDEDGVFFTQEQLLAIERINGTKRNMCGWRKIDTVRDFLLSQCEA